MVGSHALGVATNCDDYVYSFSRDALIQRVRSLIDAYELARELHELGEPLEAVTGSDSLSEIKWTDTLKQSLKRGHRIYFDESRIREVLYRPFTKLWLYEDDRILSSVRTISRMFPRDTAEPTGGGGSWSAIPGSSRSESWPPTGSSTSAQPDGRPATSPCGDLDLGHLEHDVPGAGGRHDPGPGIDQGLPADAGHPASLSSEMTGGGGGSWSHRRTTGRSSAHSRPTGLPTSVQSAPTSRPATYLGGDRDLLARESESVRAGVDQSAARPQQSGWGSENDSASPSPPHLPAASALVVSSPSNRTRFAVLAVATLVDLHAADPAGRCLPRRR